MYLSNLKLWNFRKFGSSNDLLSGDALRPADLSIDFTGGINAIIGENDSGKTAIVDAVKTILNTHTFEWIRLEQEDFHEKTSNLRIECTFSDLSDDEAKNFIEWLGFDKEEKPFLKLQLQAKRNDEKVLYYDIKAGADDVGFLLSGEAKEYLKTIYLKPLRDAKTDLVPKKNSRLSKILEAHETFKGQGNSHDLVKEFEAVEKVVEDYLKADPKGKKPKDDIEDILSRFFKDNKKINLTIVGKDLRGILEILEIALKDENLGLGSHNLLFMAAELLNLKRSDWEGVRIGLIEELEAHLHPQAQMRVIQTLQKEAEENKVQFILTTHSPNIGSKLDLNTIYISEGSNVFSLKGGKTKLKIADYKFLERFLDVTKANLFFANGVILVEGWAEELLIPTLAEKIGIDLTKKGISVVNVGSTAFLRYAKIFQREEEEKKMLVPVSIVTDLDIKPDAYNSLEGKEGAKTEKDYVLEEKITEKQILYTGEPVKTFVSPRWTLEYCIALTPILAPLLFEAIKISVKEMREDESTTYSSAEITGSFDDHFSGKSQEEIAFEIYNNLLLKKQVSKSIVAQNIAVLITESSDINFGSMRGDESPLKYIFDAIKYSAGELPSNNAE